MDMSISTELAPLFARDLKRLIQEIEAFPSDDLLWQVVPGVTNCAGNLALHMEGNLREYVGRQLGGVPYTRQRPLEFASKGLSAAALLAQLQDMPGLIERIIAGMTEEELDKPFPEQGLPQMRTNRLFLIHLYGHFSYHLGQIDYLRRILTEGKSVDFASL
jgi:hypothetical protein